MAKKIGPWTQLSSKIKYQNAWIKVREHQVITPAGKKGIYGVVESKPSVFMLPITEDNKIILVKVFRFTTKSWGWEVCAGGSEGQPLLSAAKRELLEETGYKAKQWIKVGKMSVFNGVANEIMHVFVVRKFCKVQEDKQKEEGISDMKAFSLKEIKRMLKNGEMHDSQSIAAIFVAANNLNWK